MNRRAFIESVGGTCRNWQWSWSFVNHDERFVIFGAWDRNTSGQKTMILSESWATNSQGRRNPGYSQSREHIRLVEDEGYVLKTFPMKYSGARQDDLGNGPATIAEFTPILSERSLVKIGHGWYASGTSNEVPLAEELDSAEAYVEGAKRTVTINAYERSSQARRACIQHYGLNCAVCGFNFEDTYGILGEGFIHVHHVVPVWTLKKEYEVNPIKDLVPVCPNCHAMIHRVTPPLPIDQLRDIMVRRNQ